ncbi:MAG TPA: ATP-binding protein, partial [Albitalea sp.]|nr:ATP-binding protein [Albitalea sp.]
VEKGQPQIEITDVDLPATLNHVRALVQAHPGEQQVKVSFDVPADLPVLRADRTRLVQVLTNLISNAIKFNRPGGEVRVVVRRDERGALAMQVIDNGLGMTREQQAGLFEPFNRLGRERLGIPGTGIGLVLVRHLVELMGGSIQVASDADRGTTVSLRFASVAAAT